MNHVFLGFLRTCWVLMVLLMMRAVIADSSESESIAVEKGHTSRASRRRRRGHLQSRTSSTSSHASSSSLSMLRHRDLSSKGSSESQVNTFLDFTELLPDFAVDENDGDNDGGGFLVELFWSTVSLDSDVNEEATGKTSNLLSLEVQFLSSALESLGQDPFLHHLMTFTNLQVQHYDNYFETVYSTEDSGSSIRITMGRTQDGDYDTLSGVVHLPDDKSYLLRQLPNGQIRATATTELPEIEGPVAPDREEFLQELEVRRNLEMTENSRRRMPEEQEEYVIDIMVCYTNHAMCAAVGESEGCREDGLKRATIEAVIQQSIAETNSALEHSLLNSNARLRLVEVFSIPYDEYQEPGPDEWIYLSQIANQDLELIRQRREDVGADLAVLMVENGPYCGTAWIGPSPRWAFSVVKWQCSSGYYSFGHEIGHLLGCLHNRENAGDNGANPQLFQFGKRDPEGRFRSLLAYDCRNEAGVRTKCPRIPRYSSPNVLWGGVPTGDEQSDNARWIEEHLDAFVAFREPTGSASLPFQPIPTPPDFEGPGIAVDQSVVVVGEPIHFQYSYGLENNAEFQSPSDKLVVWKIDGPEEIALLQRYTCASRNTTCPDRGWERLTLPVDFDRIGSSGILWPLPVGTYRFELDRTSDCELDRTSDNPSYVSDDFEVVRMMMEFFTGESRNAYLNQDLVELSIVSSEALSVEDTIRIYEEGETEEPVYWWYANCDDTSSRRTTEAPCDAFPIEAGIKRRMTLDLSDANLATGSYNLNYYSKSNVLLSTLPFFIDSSPSISTSPSTLPSMAPSMIPSTSSQPSTFPTRSISPTYVPTDAPTVTPSHVPSLVPSSIPSSAPSVVESMVPTSIPSNSYCPAQDVDGKVVLVYNSKKRKMEQKECRKLKDVDKNYLSTLCVSDLTIRFHLCPETCKICDDSNNKNGDDGEEVSDSGGKSNSSEKCEDSKSKFRHDSIKDGKKDVKCKDLTKEKEMDSICLSDTTIQQLCPRTCSLCD